MYKEPLFVTTDDHRDQPNTREASNALPEA